MLEEIRGVHLVAAEVKASRFDLRYVEQPVDQPGQVLRAPAHDLDGVDPPRRKLRVAFQQLRVAEDGIERRAQLVA